jgi:hypothetical protein
VLSSLSCACRVITSFFDPSPLLNSLFGVSRRVSRPDMKQPWSWVWDQNLRFQKYPVSNFLVQQRSTSRIFIILWLSILDFEPCAVFPVKIIIYPGMRWVSRQGTENKKMKIMYDCLKVDIFKDISVIKKLYHMNQFRNHMDVVFFHFFPFKSLIKF